MASPPATGSTSPSDKERSVGRHPSTDDLATLRLIGLLNLIYGMLNVLPLPLVCFGFPSGLEKPPPVLVGMAIYGLIGIASGILMLLKRYRIISVTASVVIAAIPPIGSIFGIYTIWVLSTGETLAVYRQRAERRKRGRRKRGRS